MTGSQDGPRSALREMTQADLAKLTHKQVVELVLNDPEIRARDAANPRVIRLDRRYAEAGAGLLADLSAAGFTVTKIRELEQKPGYQVTFPVLLEWLPRVGYLRLAEDITRTLSVAAGRKLVLPGFLELFRSPPQVWDPDLPASSPPAQEHLRDVLGIGLGILACPQAGDDLIEIALDRRYGGARSSVVATLPKTKDERVPEVLLSLLDDPSVAPRAVQGLGRMRYAPARPIVEKLIAHPEESMRYYAKKALKRL